MSTKYYEHSGSHDVLYRSGIGLALPSDIAHESEISTTDIFHRKILNPMGVWVGVTDGWMWVDGWVDGWMDGFMVYVCRCM